MVVVKKRKRKREGEGSEPLSRDPLEVFGTDIMLIILSNLDARSVALSLIVSRSWYGVASSDRVWSLKVLLSCFSSSSRQTQLSPNIKWLLGFYFQALK